MTRLLSLRRIDIRTKLKVYDLWIWGCCGAIAVLLVLYLLGYSTLPVMR